MDYKLSILVPTYNRLSLFEETLASILSQIKDEPVHLAIVDDGSTEGNYELALELSQKYPFIEVGRHKKNLGVGQTRNTLLRMAKGEYSLFFDSDDLLLEESLKEMLTLIMSNEAECYVLNTYRQKKKKLKFKPFPEDKSSLSLLEAYIDGAFSEALYLIRTEVAKKYPCNPNLRVREDFAQKACYLLFTNFKVVNKPFAIIREHPFRLRKMADYYFEHALASVDDLFSRLPEAYQSLKPYALAKTYFDLSKKAYHTGSYEKAMEYLKMSLKCYPELKRSFKTLKLLAKIYSKKA